MTTLYELDRARDRALPAAYAWSVHQPTGLRYHDWFCGAGGSSLGMTAAGMELAIAANHWQVAIETHSANFPHAEHVCADLTHYDLRLAPPAEVLWASPICTELSPAGGRKRRRRHRGQGELELFGTAPKKPGMERTRATFWEVIRSTELFRYLAVIVENVVEVAEDWELFDYWLDGMRILGYEVQFVSVSSAHIGSPNNPHAPQWRDRLYMVFTRKGLPLPDVEPRPRAWCHECGQDVDAVQSWKRPGRRIGKYRQQYVYRCPRRECRHAVVEPYVLPAAAAIDWSNPGTRIGDRKPQKRWGGLPLAPNTLARVEAGLRRFAQPMPAEGPASTATTTLPVDALSSAPPMTVPVGGTWRSQASPVDVPLGARTTRETDALAVPPVMVSVNHGGDDGRAYPAHAAPLPSRTARIGDGLACVPFVAELRGGGSTARSVADPLATITAGGGHHGLTVPPGAEQAFYVKNNGGYIALRDTVRSTGEPFGAVTARDSTSLVIPFRSGARPHPANRRPLSTVATREQHGLADLGATQLGLDVMDCLFRMLTAEEHLAAQRFHPSYVVHGTGEERTMQAGNAVSSNVAQWLGAAVAAAVCGEAS